MKCLNNIKLKKLAKVLHWKNMGYNNWFYNIFDAPYNRNSVILIKIDNLNIIILKNIISW